jgi:hypothetical protein
MGKVYDDTHEQPAIVDEVSDTLLYIGIPANGSPGTDEPLWSIRRIEQIGTQVFIMWAEGLDNKTFVWDNRATYDYKFLT